MTTGKTGWSKADGHYTGLEGGIVTTRAQALEEARRLVKKVKEAKEVRKKCLISSKIDRLVKQYCLSHKELYGR